jgi:hypothetical protein
MDDTHQATQQLSRALGDAVIRAWGRLPPSVQRDLFKRAVVSQSETMRSQLAIFLHERHPRTSAAIIARAMLEPDSLGG